MTHGNGVSRGDRNRNARLARLREFVPLTDAIVAIDLADRKQMVVTDHDSKVLARKTFRCRAWDLGIALDWAAQRAAAKGWAGVTVACEPKGHRWRVLGQLAADRSMPFVCVQPMVTSWARRGGAASVTPALSPSAARQIVTGSQVAESRQPGTPKAHPVISACAARMS